MAFVRSRIGNVVRILVPLSVMAVMLSLFYLPSPELIRLQPGEVDLDQDQEERSGRTDRTPTLRSLRERQTKKTGADQHFILDRSVLRPKIILYWTTSYGRADFHEGFGKKPFTDCPTSNCWTTNNRTYLDNATAVIFHGFMLKNLSDLPTQRRADQDFVFFVREAPERTSVNLKKLDNFFTMLMTHQRDSEVTHPYGKVQRREKEMEMPPLPIRTRPVAWMVSNCHTPSRREDYVRELRQHIEVDIYGRCGNFSCPDDGVRNVRKCKQYLAERYYFYLAFENCRCQDYITEKFWTALEAGIVPVVLGARSDDYLRVAPPNSFIHVDDFRRPEDLAKHLKYLMNNRSAYEELLMWRTNFSISKQRAFCDLCAYLSFPDRHPKTVLMTQRWDAGTLCRGPVFPSQP